MTIEEEAGCDDDYDYIAIALTLKLISQGS